MGAMWTLRRGSSPGPALLPSLRSMEGTFCPGLSTRSEGERREKAGEPCLETRRKVGSGELAVGHGMERSRMIKEIGGYAGDRAGGMLEVQVRQVVGTQQV